MDLMEWIKIHEDIRALLSEPLRMELLDAQEEQNRLALSQTYIALEHLLNCFTVRLEDQSCLPNVALFLIALLTCQQGCGILLHFDLFV